LSIAVALVLLLFCGYWFAYRPLPQTSGTLPAPISSRATVSRDSLGVPHIVAATQEDALFLQGFVTAQDRLWQMDALRRLAAGELAEVLGRPALESDRESRRLRLRRIAEQQYRDLPPKDRAVLAAYARGVNFFLETNRDRLPLEFSLLRYDPRPWSVVDSLLVALQMTRTLTRSWRIELRKENLLEGGEAGKVNFLFPTRTGGEFQPGSNAWVVSGARTATERPLLASDPHLEFSVPAPWYMVHLEAPGLNVTGVSVPGLPCVIIGHNDRIAWGVTNLQFDVQDLYIEQFNAQGGRYRFRGGMEQARPEREFIRVKRERPVQIANWVTRHGPLFLAEGDRFVFLRWVAAESSGFQFPFLDLNRAEDWRQFTAALSRLSSPASNFVYADVDGNIGYHVAGKLPIRRSYSGDVPVDGSSGDFEWQGFIPFEELPSAYNPASGVIVTANQNPFPEDYPYQVSGFFAAHYRTRQILELLSVRKAWRAGQMLPIQTDLYSAFSHFLAREVVAAYDRRDVASPSLGAAVSLLRAWNGQMEPNTPAPMIVTLTYQHLRKAIAERASPGKGSVYVHRMAPAAVEKLLRDRPADWFPDYDQLLLRSLTDALEEGLETQGGDVNKWDYGRYNELLLPHPILSRLPVLGKYFNVGPVAMGGSPTTVLQMAQGKGPSMRMVIDLSDWDRSLQNITLGQSGHALSRHYKDQWDAYYSGRSFPMQYRNIDATETLVFVPESE
jgi:penicillin amidase